MDDTFVRSMSGIKHVQNFDGGLLCQKASETYIVASAPWHSPLIGRRDQSCLRSKSSSIMVSEVFL